jgi:hypothetical protein
MTTPTEFDLVRSILAAVAEGELATKGPDYAHHLNQGEIDRLANFKGVAARLEGAPTDLTTVCAVYFEKHIFAIERAVKDRQLSSEGLLGRFADARNYLDLLLACFAESNPELVPGVAGELATESVEGPEPMPFVVRRKSETQVLKEEDNGRGNQ